MITAFEILAIVLIVVARLRMSTRAQSTVDEPEPAPEDDPAVLRARATIAWAEGTRMDWDRHVRPVLARELGELFRSRRDPESMPANEIGQRMLGGELWALVDPRHPFTTELDQPGPGRAGLTAILDRLERL